MLHNLSHESHTQYLAGTQAPLHEMSDAQAQTHKR